MKKSPYFLSVCSICKNEEKFIQGFISQFSDFPVEILISDTGSTDSTPDILKENQINFEQIAWENDFSKARNISIQKATAPWILILDIDERISQANLQKVLNLISMQNTNAAYTLICTNLSFSEDLQKKFIHSTHKVLRLLPNIVGLKFENAVHESAEKSLIQNSIPIQESEIEMTHLGYSGSLYTKKLERNKSLLDKGALVDKDPMQIYYWAQSHWGNNPVILQLLEEAIATSSVEISQILIEILYLWLHEFNPHSKNFEKYETVLRNLFPKSPARLLVSARRAFCTKNLEESIRLYEMIKNQCISSASLSFFRPEILCNLAILHACKGNFPIALELIYEFETIYSIDKVLFHQKIKILAVLGEKEKIRSCLNNIPDDIFSLPEHKILELKKICNHFFPGFNI